MKEFRIDIRKLRLPNYGGLSLTIALIVATMLLCFTLIRNPYRALHQDIFVTADKIRSHYRDRPGYWKLSTATAKQDNLIGAELLDHDGYDVRVGMGREGESGMPNDATFDIVLSNLSKSACINLTELPIDESQKLGLQKITIVTDNGITEFAWGGEYPLPIAKYDVRDICQPGDNIVMWTFQ